MSDQIIGAIFNIEAGLMAVEEDYVFESWHTSSHEITRYLMQYH